MVILIRITQKRSWKKSYDWKSWKRKKSLRIILRNGKIKVRVRSSLSTRSLRKGKETWTIKERVRTQKNRIWNKNSKRIRRKGEIIQRSLNTWGIEKKRTWSKTWIRKSWKRKTSWLSSYGKRITSSTRKRRKFKTLSLIWIIRKRSLTYSWKKISRITIGVRIA